MSSAGKTSSAQLDKLHGERDRYYAEADRCWGQAKSIEAQIVKIKRETLPKGQKVKYIGAVDSNAEIADAIGIVRKLKRTRCVVDFRTLNSRSVLVVPIVDLAPIADQDESYHFAVDDEGPDDHDELDAAVRATCGLWRTGCWDNT